MNSPQQSERQTTRLIVVGPYGGDILVKKTRRGFALPSVRSPRRERLAENLTATLKQDLGLDAVCLFTADSQDDDDSSGSCYEVLQCWRDEAVRTETLWEPILCVEANSFLHSADFRALQQCLHQLETYERDGSSPFAKRGWLSTLQNWISAVIHPLGLELKYSLQQFNAGPAFDLTRFETTGPAVWFKAVGEPNQREFPITMKLAELFPRFMPKILATKDDWNGWLSREVQGGNLGKGKNIEGWEQAAADLAKLQIESITSSRSLLPLGAHDLQSDALTSAISPFFDLVDRLMDEQEKTPPAVLSRAELNQTRRIVDDALTMLADLRIPTTIGHLDLNPWNIIISDSGTVFLDWAEAYVGHPFFSLEYLLQHFRHNSEDRAKFDRVVKAYKTSWQESLSDDCTSEALAFAPLAAVFAYAIEGDAWRDEKRLRDPKVAGYFRSLARRMHREALQLAGRPSCLS